MGEPNHEVDEASGIWIVFFLFSCRFAWVRGFQLVTQFGTIGDVLDLRLTLTSMTKTADTMAILKLYELRRDDQMRSARQWYFSEFAPRSPLDIVALYRGGERASANFRMVTSYWDTAASLVLNGGIDRQMFLDANTEHVFIYAKIADYLGEVRDMFREPDFLIHLETLVRSMSDFKTKMESRKRLIATWEKK